MAKEDWINLEHHDKKLYLQSLSSRLMAEGFEEVELMLKRGFKFSDEDIV